ncbi:MAG TPA: hypothetical protein VLA34_00730, partial [Candidatus Krumholzibacterium sp.]|nr:hypothetical protein [Candidatus Krumholzibacterium sp.]
MGEIAIRMGDEEKGVALVRRYVEGADQSQALAASRHGEGFRDAKDRLAFAFERITAIPDGIFCGGRLPFFAAEMAASLERTADGVRQLERLNAHSPGHESDIIEWLGGNEATSRSAPAQRFLLTLNLRTGDSKASASASRVAAEMDHSSINWIISTIREALEGNDGRDKELLAALAELHALNGDSESASSVMERLEEEGDLEKEELFRLTGKILDKCGVTLDRVMTAVQLSLKNSDISGALPWVVEFFRSNTDAHGEFASRLKAAAGDDERSWILLSEMIDSMAQEVKLTKPFRRLQARGHLLRGDIEKAIFEFDQMIMFDESIRMDLIPLYEKAIESHPENTTLNLALYQLNLDEEFYQRSAHYLCRALESDPGQIRDVLSNFHKLTLKDPGNRAIWEEMLGAALRMDHADLARDILSKAIAALPENEAAALNVYGARISAADGKSLESLGHLAAALRSEEVDLASVEQQLKQIIKKEPMNPEARYLAGETLLRLTREEEAAAQMEKCLELSPAYSERVREKLEHLLPMSVKPWLVSRILGEISWNDGRKADAYRFFNSAQKGPGESLHGLNEALGRILDAQPDDSRITSIYARGLSLEHRYDEAVRQLEDLFRRDADSTGRIMEILLEMLEDSPDHFTANRLSADIWIASGDPERSLLPVLQMISNDRMDPREIEADVD